MRANGYRQTGLESAMSKLVVDGGGRSVGGGRVMAVVMADYRYRDLRQQQKAQE